MEGERDEWREEQREGGMDGWVGGRPNGPVS